MSALFALLAGVAQYHPNSEVPPLRACKNDVNNMEACLRARMMPGDCHIISLINETATREALIASFTSHLIHNDKFQAGDTALFYYSGHGSYQRSNASFAADDSEGIDETLVLYDSRLAGRHDLADKELALLISHIPADVNIVVILDSCHSGSAMRHLPGRNDATGSAKFLPGSDAEGRSLDTYCTVDGVGYPQMVQADGTIRVPGARYVSLAACSRRQLAYECSDRDESLFTHHLLQLLSLSGPLLSYAGVNDLLYTFLYRWSNKQTPQLVVCNGFDPDMAFLGSTILRGQTAYRVIPELDGRLTIDAGALHGLWQTRESLDQVLVRIYQEDDAPPISTRFSSIGLDRSELVSVDLEDKIYRASLVNIPPVCQIGLRGDDAQLRQWATNIGENPIRSLALTQTGDPDMLLHLDSDRLYLSCMTSGRIIHGVADPSVAGMQYMLAVCERITRWYSLLKLDNPPSKPLLASQVAYGLELQTNGGVQPSAWQLIEKEDFCFTIAEGEEIPYRLHISTPGAQDLYVAIFYLSGQYGVRRMTGWSDQSRLLQGKPLERVYRKSKFSLPPGVIEETDRFRLIVSEEPFKDHLVPDQEDLLPGIVSGDQIPRAVNRSTTSPPHLRWHTRLITVTVTSKTSNVP